MPEINKKNLSVLTAAACLLTVVPAVSTYSAETALDPGFSGKGITYGPRAEAIGAGTSSRDEKKDPDVWKDVIVESNLLRGYRVDELQLWNKTLSAYQAKGLTEKDAIKTARLVSMHQLDEKGNLDLWLPPKGE